MMAANCPYVVLSQMMMIQIACWIIRDHKQVVIEWKLPCLPLALTLKVMTRHVQVMTRTSYHRQAMMNLARPSSL